MPRVPSDAPEWPRGFPKASYVVTEENSGRKQESLVATPRQMLPGHTFLQFVVATVLEPKSEPGRCKRRYKGYPKGLGVLDPIPICVYVAVLVSHTAKQLSGPAGCPAIQLNADIIYMEGALVSTG